MKTYYLNENKTSVVAIDSDGSVERFNWLMSTDVVEESNVKVPSVVVAKDTGTGGTLDFHSEFSTSTEIVKKKRGRKPGSKNKKQEGVAPKKEQPTMGLPKVLVNEYGIDIVEKVLYEKNVGIGFTAEEIFDKSIPALAFLTLPTIERIVDGLIEAGL